MKKVWGVVSLVALGMFCGCNDESRQPQNPKSASSPVASPVAPTAPKSTAPPPQTFTLGLAGPFTGSSAELGIPGKMAVELFVSKLNAAGGINGRQLKINVQDDAGKASEAQTVASSLASDESVLAVIGHYNSSCSLNGKPIYTQAKMVMFSPASTNVEVTTNSEYVYRDIYTDKFQGESLAQYCTVVGLKNVAILFDNDDYGVGLKQSFKSRGHELGVHVAVEEAYNREQPDYRSQLTAIQGLQPPPDAILVAGLYNEAANIARQSRELGIKAQFLGGDGVFSQQFITLAGAAAEGTLVSTPFLFDLGTDKATKFAEAYRAKYHREPDAWSALSYDAISIVCEGIRKNGFTRDAVLQYLKSVNSPDTAFDGLAGKTFFDAHGDCKKPVQIAQVRGGKFVAAEKQLGVDGKVVIVKSPASSETTSTSH